jgi:hypothetical protein
MRKISERQFDAFCYSREPFVSILSKEVAWYEAFDRKILATIIFDYIDNDFGFVILGRDSKKIFRCIYCCTDYQTIEEAKLNLANALLNYKNDGCETYPQGDEKETPNDILVPRVPESKMHPYFKILLHESGYEGARNLIKEIVYSYIDPDGHYIKEFQTHGFDARLWELYLYVYLYNAGFKFIRGNPSPDFHLSFFGNECLIEAVTVNPSQNPNRPDPECPKSIEEICNPDQIWKFIIFKTKKTLLGKRPC